MDILPDPRIRQELSELSGWPTIPQLFVGGELVGGCDIVTEMFESGELAETLGVEQPAAAQPPRRPRRAGAAAADRVAPRERGRRARSYAHERHYTVEQANAALPWVGERLDRIRDALASCCRRARARGASSRWTPTRRRRLSRAAPRRGAMLTLLTAADAARGDRRRAARPRPRAWSTSPSIRDGDEVYLCWEARRGSACALVARARRRASPAASRSSAAATTRAEPTGSACAT